MTFLFEFSAFGFGLGRGTECNVRKNIAMQMGCISSCSSLSWDFAGGSLRCKCGGIPIPSSCNTPTCPTGTDLKKKPLAFAPEVQISCRNFAYINPRRNGRDLVNQNENLYPYRANQIRVDESKPLRMCWASWNPNNPNTRISGSALRQNPSSCGSRSHHLDRSSSSRSVPLWIMATCEHNNNNDQKCRDIVRNMLDGKVTFKPTQLGGKITPDYDEDNPDQGNWCGERSNGLNSPTAKCRADRYRRDNGDNPQYAVYKRLWDTASQSYTNDYVVLYAEEYDYMFNETYPLRDMQCLSDNIQMRQFCECRSSNPPLAPYEFELGRDNSCFCSDGTTPKDDEEGSNCPTPVTCPATEGSGKDDYSLGQDGNDCRCKCSNDSSDSFLIPSGTASCPVVDSNTGTLTPLPSGTLSDGSTVTGNECNIPEPPTCDIPMPASHIATDNTFYDFDGDGTPEKPLHDDHHSTADHPHSLPGGKHYHPYVSKAQICSDGRSPVLDNNKYYCYQDKETCPTRTNTETKACTDGTALGNDYGKCTKQDGNSKCVLVETDVNLQPNNFKVEGPTVRGQCREGYTLFQADEVKGLCDSSAFVSSENTMNLNPIIVVPCHSHNNTIPRVIGETEGLKTKCVCVTPPATSNVRYTCSDGGIPSSQDDQCKCQDPSRSIKTCDPNPNGEWLRQQDISPGTCDCPSGWTEDDKSTSDESDDTCSKAPLSSDTFPYRRGIQCQCGPGTTDRCFPDKTGDPTSVASAVANNWNCNTDFPLEDISGCSELNNVQLAAHHILCFTNEDVKSCTEGGRYDSTLDKCVQPCTPEPTVESCTCVKKSEVPCTICPAGYTAAPPRNGVEQCRKELDGCVCNCYVGNLQTPKSCQFTKQFMPGKEIYNKIKNNPLRCIKRPSEGCCCHGGVKYPSCPVLNPDKVCPSYDPDPDTCPSCCHNGEEYNNVICPVSNPDGVCCCHDCKDYGEPSCPASITDSDGNTVQRANFDNKCPTDPTCKKCPIDGRPKPADPGGCCLGLAVNNMKTECPFDGISTRTNPKGVDMAFSSNDFSSILSVYSLGSMNRPDFICWEMKTENGKTMKVQRRDAFCPPQRECEEAICRCQTWDANRDPVIHDNTQCEYASSDPMRYEEGILRGDIPTQASERKGDDSSTRFFKTTTIVTP